MLALSVTGRKPSTRKFEKWLGALGGLVLLVLGLILSFSQSSMIWSCLRARAWRSQPCTIVSVKVVDNKERKSPHNIEATVFYRWNARGREIEWNSLTPYSTVTNPNFFKAGAIDELKAAIGVHHGYQCFVNPDDPREVALFRDTHRGDIFIGALGSFMFIVAGVVGLLEFFRSPAQRRCDFARETNPDHPHLWREDWATGFVEENRPWNSGMARLIALFLILTMVPSMAGLFLADHWDGGRVGVIVFISLLIVWPAWWLVRGWFRFRKFGRFTFVPVTVPLRPGSLLKGTIALMHPLRIPAMVSAKVVVWTTQKRRWRGDKTNLLCSLDAGVEVCESAIGVRADLPLHPGTTMDESKLKHQWRLVVTCRRNRIEIEFTLPVFEEQNHPGT